MKAKSAGRASQEARKRAEPTRHPWTNWRPVGYPRLLVGTIVAFCCWVAFLIWIVVAQ
jgi:hypothetical protein